LKWKHKAAEKSAVDQQTHEMLQKFKMNKIGKEFGQLVGEELFETITKRLEKSTPKQEKAEVDETPGYGMDELGRINPIGDDFRPDTPTPTPTPASSSPHHHHCHHFLMLMLMVMVSFPNHSHRWKKLPYAKRGGTLGRFSTNIHMNQPCCKRSIS